jgi:hypothetical protein
MLTLVEEVSKAKELGAKSIAEFGGAVRSIENTNFEAGDTFTIPEDFTGQIWEEPIQGSNKVMQYIFVELTNGKVKRLYPSVFTKARQVYNEDGTMTNKRVYTTGSAADLFRTKGTVQDAMNLLKGKTITVKAINEVRTLRYGTTDLMSAQIPVLDLVDNKKK